VGAVWWRKEDYDSIAGCHRSKGFDPASQDVAIELGHPLVDVDRLERLINDEKAAILGSRRRHSI
jgi:hypothetical protein